MSQQQHKISLFTAILMNINIMVGSGILFGPGIIAAVSGNASFLTWLMVAFIFLPIVLCTVELSRMFPGAGGFYAYAKEGLGMRAGYWAGWIYIVGYTFAAAMETLALRKTLIEAFNLNWPWLTQNHIYFNLLAVIIFTALNFLSLRILSGILNSITIAKIIPLLVLIALIPFVFNYNFTITGGELSALPLSLSMAIFGYFGFEYCSSISHHIENSERNAPLAILIGFFVTALLYTLFHFGALNIMGVEELVRQGAPAFAEFITLPIPFLKTGLSILIPAASAITLFGAANGVLNSNATMLHAMAEKNVFYKSRTLTQLTTAHRPWIMILIQACAIFAITTGSSLITGDLNRAILIVSNLCIIGVFTSFTLPFASLIVIQRRNKQHKHIALTVLGLIAVAGLALYSMYSLAPTMHQRLVLSLPLLLLFALGAVIAKRN
ncbi:MAG: APC family permease [Candidatus Babeliales bacterium]